MDPVVFTSFACVSFCVFLALRAVFGPTENRQASLFFAGFLLAAASYVLAELSIREGWYVVWPGLVESANVTVLCIGPCFYLYSRSALDSSFRVRWAHLACFALPLLLLPFVVAVQAMPLTERIASIRADQVAMENGHPATSTLIFLAVFDAYHLGFLGAAWRRLWLGRATLEREREEGRSHPVRALGLFATVVLGIAVVSAVLDFSPWAGHNGVVTSLAILLVVFTLLWISSSTNPFTPPRVPVGEAVSAPAAHAPAAPPLSRDLAAPIPNPPAPPAAAPAAPSASAEPSAPAVVAASVEASEPRLRRDMLRPEDVERLARKLQQLFDREHIYLDPNLSLQSLAGRLGTTRHKVSFVINERFGGTFYQVIAAYRVKAAAALLLAEAEGPRTIADIALASGFNSLSAFNSAFRTHHGVTPRAYRENARARPSPGSAVTQNG